jgi:ribonuclease HI
MLVEMSQPWKMFFDGAAQRDGAGAGVVFVTPEGDVLPYSFTLVKCCSKNVAEYQALILGLKMAMNSKTTCLEVFNDSKLIINEVLLEYEV